jgi:elongation factor Ts
VKSKEEFMDLPFEGSNVQEVLKSKIAKIGENMNIRRFERHSAAGTVYKGYIHGNGTIGVIVGIKTEASAEETEEAGKDVAMQVASMNPKFLDGNDVDPKFIAEEKKILTQQVLNEGKKPEMVDRIVEGKLKKELKEYCLLEQKFVKDSEITVKQYIENTGKTKGKDMEVTSFVRFEVGEGIEKKEEDFAEEVAKQMGMSK